MDFSRLIFRVRRLAAWGQSPIVPAGPFAWLTNINMSQFSPKMKLGIFEKRRIPQVKIIPGGYLGNGIFAENIPYSSGKDREWEWKFFLEKGAYSPGMAGLSPAHGLRGHGLRGGTESQ